MACYDRIPMSESVKRAISSSRWEAIYQRIFWAINQSNQSPQPVVVAVDPWYVGSVVYMHWCKVLFSSARYLWLCAWQTFKCTAQLILAIENVMAYCRKYSRMHLTFYATSRTLTKCKTRGKARKSNVPWINRKWINKTPAVDIICVAILKQPVDACKWVP